MKKITPDDVVAEMPDVVNEGIMHAISLIGDESNVLTKMSSIFCAGAQYAMQHMESKKEAEELLKGYKNAKID